MDGTAVIPYPWNGSQPVALTMLDPPELSTGPRLNSHSTGPMPDVPNDSWVAVRVCRSPQRQSAGSSPSSSVSSSAAASIAAASTSSRPLASSPRHQCESGSSKSPETTYIPRELPLMASGSSSSNSSGSRWRQVAW
jgi:hypothetical protein